MPAATDARAVGFAGGTPGNESATYPCRTPYVIVDIGLRMLKPHELYRAQGFPARHIIDRTANGTPLTTSAAVRMVGNSVSPPPLRALAEANLDPATSPLAVAA